MPEQRRDAPSGPKEREAVRLGRVMCAVRRGQMFKICVRMS